MIRPITSILLASTLFACTSGPQLPDTQLLAAAMRAVKPNKSIYVTDGQLVSGLYFVVDSGYGYPRHGFNDAYSHNAVFVPGVSDVLYVDPTPIVTVGNFTRIEVDEGLDGRPEVRIEMDPIGAVRWQVGSRRSKQKQVAIVVRDSVVSAPVVLDMIPNGRAAISMGGGATESEAEELANWLNAERASVPPMR